MSNSFHHKHDIPIGLYGPPLFQQKLLVELSELLTHTRIIGKSGMGKSFFIATLFVALLNRGLSATLIDPHGDLAHLVLNSLIATGFFKHPSAFDRLIFLDLPEAERRDLFFPFNVLNQRFKTPTTTRNVMEAMKRAWPSLADGTAPMFENIVLAGMFVLSHHKLPLIKLHDVLLDKSYRDELLKDVQDKEIVKFFHGRYDNFKSTMQVESTLRRFFLLMFSPILRYSFAQADNILKFRNIIDTNRSVIVNLAIEDNDARKLLGCLLTVGVEQAALSRADTPIEKRKHTHFLMIDEFGTFVAQSSESLSHILSQCRKYKVPLILSHQTEGQTSNHLRDALQNVGMDIIFGLGKDDAEHTAARLVRSASPHHTNILFDILFQGGQAVSSQ